MAYLKAMDNRYDLKESLLYAEKALKINPTSFTYNIIYSIVLAQNECGKKVYDITNKLRSKKLDMDMKSEAIDIIYEYMDLYKDEPYYGIHNITGLSYNEEDYN